MSLTLLVVPPILLLPDVLELVFPLLGLVVPLLNPLLDSSVEECWAPGEGNNGDALYADVDGEAITDDGDAAAAAANVEMDFGGSVPQLWIPAVRLGLVKLIGPELGEDIRLLRDPKVIPGAWLPLPVLPLMLYKLLQLL